MTAEITVPTDGGTCHFELNCSAVRDTRGKPVGKLLVLREITLLKERERQLRRKNEALDEFAAVISHDVSTPLGVIENKAHLVEMTGDPDHVDGIQSASRQVRELIDELRELAKQGKRIGDTEPVTLSAVSRGAWSRLSSGDGDKPGTVDRTFRVTEPSSARRCPDKRCIFLRKIPVGISFSCTCIIGI